MDRRSALACATIFSVALNGCVRTLQFVSESPVENAPIREEVIPDPERSSRKLLLSVHKDGFLEVRAAYSGLVTIRKYQKVQQRFWTGDGYWMPIAEKMIDETKPSSTDLPIEDLPVDLSDDGGNHWNGRTGRDGMLRINLGPSNLSNRLFTAKAVIGGKTMVSDVRVP